METQALQGETKASRLSKLKTLAKTRKFKIAAAIVSVVLLCMIAVIALVLNGSKTPEVQIAPNIASDKIYDNYDFIYNTDDNKLVASTLDKVKQLELVSGDEKIMDYVISPDKKRITYSLSDKDYKNKIFASNMDVSKLKFDPIAFKVFELNLETGENKLIWSTDRIDLGATNQQIYNKKIVIYPDSYSVYVNEYDELISYPVSYVEYVDDIAAGYNTSYLPYDLSNRLGAHEIKLVGYDSDNTKIILLQGNELLLYNIADSNISKFSVSTDGNPDCVPYNKNIINNIVSMYLGCGYAGYQKAFALKDRNFTDIYNEVQHSGSLSIITAKNENAIVQNYYPYNPPETNRPSINRLNINDKSLTKIRDLEKSETTHQIEVIGSDDIYLLTSLPEDTENYSGDRIYTINRYNNEDNTMSPIESIKLPQDLYNFIYNPAKNTLSYYRNYNAATETIIEYRIVDIQTKEEKELLSIKVSNDSVLYFKPKLVWLGID